MKCQHCGCFLTLEQLSYILCADLSIDCDRCGKECYLEDADVIMSQDSKVRARSPFSFAWFHATMVENWLDTVISKGARTVHVGTKQAAIDRSHDFPTGKTMFLHKLKIKADTRFYPTISQDDDNVSCVGLRARRYTNRWEAPGSLSIAINPRDLRIVSSETFQTDDVLSLPSIYNVDTTEISKRTEKLRGMESELTFA